MSEPPDRPHQHAIEEIHGAEDRCAPLRSVDSGIMRYQITLRYGGRHQRYHTYVVEAADARLALEVAAGKMPDEIVTEVDLVELRVAVDPDRRAYLGGETE